MFDSGIGIRYASSIITDIKYQACAKHLIIGERVVPQMVVRAADGRPYQLQDLLPADARFKLLVFAGDTDDDSVFDTLNKCAVILEQILSKYAGNKGLSKMFEILTIRFDIITPCLFLKLR